jgi:hypothetical protein
MRKRDIFECFTIISLSFAIKDPAQCLLSNTRRWWLWGEYAIACKGWQLITVSPAQRLLIKTYYRFACNAHPCNIEVAAFQQVPVPLS